MRALLLSSLLAPGLFAQSTTTPLQEGDLIPGVGNLTSIIRLEITDEGTWLAHGDTNASGGVDHVLLRDGTLFLQERDFLPDPAGFFANEFYEWDVDRDGNVFHEVLLSDGGMPFPFRQVSVIYRKR